MKTFNLNFFATLLVVSMLIMGCNNRTQPDNSSTKSVTEKIMSSQDIKPEIAKILYQFPTPYEVTVILEKSKAGFIFDITNPVENLDKYMTEQAKALFLGVYSADLSYAAAYNRSDEIKSLMKCTSKLTDELGISGIYNENLVETVKSNYDNKEVLVTLFTKVFEETKSFLSKNNKDRVSALIVTGGFVETMHIVTSLNMLAKDNREISKIIFDQQKNLDILLNILDAFSSDESIKKISEPLTKIKGFYTNNPLETNEALSAEKATEIKDLVDAARVSLGN